jgi:hypothetical protein
MVQCYGHFYVQRYVYVTNAGKVFVNWCACIGLEGFVNTGVHKSQVAMVTDFLWWCLEFWCVFRFLEKLCTSVLVCKKLILKQILVFLIQTLRY